MAQFVQKKDHYEKKGLDEKWSMTTFIIGAVKL
jgi:hypothetical protein